MGSVLLTHKFPFLDESNADLARFRRFFPVSRALWWLVSALQVLAISPLIWNVIWGISVTVWVDPPVVGCGVFLIWTSGMITFYGMMLWRSRGWRLRRTSGKLLSAVEALLLAAFLLFCAFEFCAIFLTTHSFVGTSYCFLAFNMLRK